MPLGYVYILQSDRSGRYYVGSCLDPSRRLVQHQANAVAATRGKGPWRRVACVAFEDAATARHAEVYLKRLKRRDLLERVIRGEFEWPLDLAPVASRW